MSNAPMDPMDKRLEGLTPERRALLKQMLERKPAEPPRSLIPRRPASSAIPLSYSQQRIWFLEQLASGTAAHNMDVLLRVRAPYNVPALQRALNEIVRRHESLRTTFRADAGVPTQVVAPSLEIRLPLTDLRYLPLAERAAEGIRLATEDARQPFDLARGPLFRARAFRLDDEDYLLLLAMHHIVSDFVSMTVFFDELSAAYESFSNGLPLRLPDVAVQYPDFACWQRGAGGAERFDGQLAYWRERLAGVPPVCLPTDRPRPTIASAEGATSTLVLAPHVVKGVRELSAAEGVTAFTTFLTAFKILLLRYTGQSDLAIGVASAGRHRLELQRVIGFFVNSLVMRTDLGGDPKFRHCLARVERTVAEAFANQDVPFEKLVEDLQPERILNQNPLFQIAFQLLPLKRSAEFAERLWIERQTASLDLAVELIDSPECLTVRAEYATALFDQDTIERLLRHYETLLEAIVTDPERRISELEILDAASRRMLLEDWSRSRVTVDEELVPAHRLVEAQAQETPGAIAIVSGDSEYTYAELDDRASEIARQLRGHGIGPGHLVAVAIPPSFELYASMLGVLKSGAAYLPLDASQSDARSESILSDAGPSTILTAAGLSTRLAESGAKVPDDTAYVIYTSGSTGRPKGVMIDHRALANQLRWMQDTFPLGPSDCVLQKYPVAFDAAAVEIFATLGAGGRLVAIDRLTAIDVGRLAGLMREHRVTVLDAVPSLLDALLDHPAAFAGLTRVVSGGEAMPVHLLARLRETGVREIVNMYGPTEATITACAWVDDGRRGIGRVPIGRPITNMCAYVLDERMQPVPVGVPGELYLGGVGLARGYVGAPELTASVFVPNPFDPETTPRLYRTGDLVRFLPDRNLEYMGRTDRQAKIRGFRVEPREVEMALREHAGVVDCAVVQEPTKAGGGLAACVVPAAVVPELWPSVGEYLVYDDLMYHAMTSDKARNAAYRSAIERSVRDKIVLDIGTGADLLWARTAIEAGARRVYAVETLADAARRASDLAARLGLVDRVSVIHGDSRQIDLPEPVDVILSELIGTIGSSEGAATILSDARRFLAPGGTTIPRRCVTRLAAVELPAGIWEYPTFTEVSSHYVQRIFEVVGRPFDVRLCVKGASRAHLLSDDAVFEVLDFDALPPSETRAAFRLTASREGSLHGLLLWIELNPGGELTIDTLEGTYSWLPVFVPLGDPPLRVRPGDRIEGTVEVAYPNAQVCPDYRIAGRVLRDGRPGVAFDYQSPHSTGAFRENPFYQALFRSDGSPRSDGLMSAAAMRAWLTHRLPDYMIPGSVTFAPALPLTASGKLDVAAVSSGPRSRPAGYVAPQSELERAVARVWAQVLTLDQVGVHDNFFDLGGHSLLLVRLQQELRRALAADVSLTDLFQFPTVRSLADALHKRQSEPVVSG